MIFRSLRAPLSRKVKSHLVYDLLLPNRQVNKNFNKKTLEVLLTIIQYRGDFRDSENTQVDIWEMSSPFQWN